MGGNVVIYGCSFTGCTTTGKGGGIFTDGCNIVNITNSIFQNNSARFGGGAYHTQTDQIFLTRITVIDNQAEFIGGLMLDGTEKTNFLSHVKYTNITHNKAIEWCGGIRCDHGGGIFENSVIDSNEAKTSAGFFDFAWKPSKRTLKFSIFSNNIADHRSGGFCAFHVIHESSFSYCEFFGNNCKNDPNSIYIESVDSVVSLENCFFQGEKNEEIGIRFDSSEFVLNENVTFGAKPTHARKEP
ncbi:chlamydia polymorphic membrane protein [Histomonas meleagridis]|uniref:chlamydia polymorphic membrane protein n=1 Tax=Histomonas meleagridis TaxID=135588 RepID=UPI00355A8C68|nr:chlamydia polymorphic membrane protein [Histomonas meleagridis]KAH0797618.1 chlamydia polymorphic membrane protein [Histomonas meleagridis]